MAEQDHQHLPRRDDTEEGGDAQLQQQISRRQEGRQIVAADQQNHHDAAKGHQHGIVEATDQRPGRVAARGLLRAEQFQAVAIGQDADRADADRRHQHHALEQRLCQRRDAGEQQQAADRAQRVGSEDRTNDPAAAAEQRGAANDHGGDRLQCVVGSHLRVARQRLQRQEQAAAGRQQARERIGGQPGAADPNAGQECRGLGRSGSVTATPQDGVAERHPHHQQYADQQQQRSRDHTEGFVCQQVTKIFVDAAAGDGAQQIGDSGEDRASRQRRDDWLYAPDNDDQSVDKSASGARKQRDRNADEDLPRRAADQMRGDAIAERQHRPDRKIEAAGQHRQRLRHRREGKREALICRRGRHHDRQAARMQGHEGEEQDQEQGRREDRALIAPGGAEQSVHAGAAVPGSPPGAASIDSDAATMLASVIAAPLSSRTTWPR